jgi:hypothetical protein
VQDSYDRRSGESLSWPERELARFLGLGEDATDVAILAAATARIKAASSCEEALRLFRSRKDDTWVSEPEGSAVTVGCRSKADATLVYQSLLSFFQADSRSSDPQVAVAPLRGFPFETTMLAMNIAAIRSTASTLSQGMRDQTRAMQLLQENWDCNDSPLNVARAERDHVVREREIDRSHLDAVRAALGVSANNDELAGLVAALKKDGVPSGLVQVRPDCTIRWSSVVKLEVSTADSQPCYVTMFFLSDGRDVASSSKKTREAALEDFKKFNHAWQLWAEQTKA